VFESSSGSVTQFLLGGDFRTLRFVCSAYLSASKQPRTTHTINRQTCSSSSVHYKAAEVRSVEIGYV